MSTNTCMKIVCNGELINKMSEGKSPRNWQNPFDFLPPVGSIIHYKTSDTEEKGSLLTKYIVKSHTFTTSEFFDKYYVNKTCTIHVELA